MLYILLIGNIICWHGNENAIERAFNVEAPLNEFVFTAIREHQRSMNRQSQNSSAHHRLDHEPIVTDKSSEDDCLDLNVNCDIPVLFRVSSHEIQELSLQKDRPN